MILALASSAHAFFNCVGKDDPAVQDIPEPRDNSGYCVGNGADAGARRLPCSGDTSCTYDKTYKHPGCRPQWTLGFALC
ncbi:unnamed protein product [Zymoseptoria tritici ST99CH_3D7]|uniref:Uncharacterized protein n=2 Tax=Zymoseptoria tritici TaxID=1047171 RepID=A0A1X7RJS8_ZYMT9|nr:unnamed protein product [Zymoseptoria tritici ST99CH_3D7]SMR46192.1 unnamed protein product [Zymoseptoria tritici ST99CH_1E4]